MFACMNKLVIMCSVQFLGPGLFLFFFFSQPSINEQTWNQIRSKTTNSHSSSVCSETVGTRIMTIYIILSICQSKSCVR